MLCYVDIHHTATFIEDSSFSIEMSLHPCEKSVDHRCLGLFLDSEFYSIDLLVPALHHFDYSSLISFEVNIVLALQGLLQFHMNLRISLSIPEKRPVEFWERLHWIYRLLWGLWLLKNVFPSMNMDMGCLFVYFGLL